MKGGTLYWVELPASETNLPCLYLFVNSLFADRALIQTNFGQKIGHIVNMQTIHHASIIVS